MNLKKLFDLLLSNSAFSSESSQKKEKIIPLELTLSANHSERPDAEEIY
jgi:hypothetical protein